MAPETPLLERDAAVAALASVLDAVRAGHGRCLVVSGEAGVGKTRLLQAAQALAADLQWLGAACDPLLTPRPLGPLVDLSARLPPALGDAVHAARTYNGLFPALADWLARARPPVVLALEDLHWADEATLDCVRYLGRRIAGLPALLLLTRRDDEASPALARTLAQLDPVATVHVALTPLSQAAVERIAALCDREDGAALWQRSGGNPLFVQQLLAAAPGVLPAGVRDAVSGRLAALPGRQRALLQSLAVAPGGLEPEHLAAPADGVEAGLDALVASGWLCVTPARVNFRHELVREAVDAAMPPARRCACHLALSARLAEAPVRPGMLARRLHHAAGAGRAAEVVALASAAADEAERAGAPAAAAQVLGLALAHADAGGADDTQRGAWGLALARLQARAGRLSEAVATLGDVLARARRVHDLPAAVRAQANLALLLSPQPQARAHADAAWADAQRCGGVDAALAAYALALVLHNRGDPAAARPHAEMAVHLAESAGDPLTLSQALSVCGAVVLSLDPGDAGFSMLERGIALAVQSRRFGAAAVAWVNVAGLCLARADYPRLQAALAHALPFCRDHDEDLAAAMLQLRAVLGAMETADWGAVEAGLARLRRAPGASARTGASAALVALRLQGLRDAPAEEAAWRVAVAAVESGETEFQPADACGYAAEAAWLRGDGAAAAAWARRGLAQAASPWLAGRLRRWLRLGGADPGRPPADGLPAPLRAEEAGDVVGARTAWRALGCPLEASVAVLSAQAAQAAQAAADMASLHTAWDEAVRIGARPLADRLRQALHAQGRRVAVSARGPYRAAAAHPLGFTAREQEVAALLAAGLGNAQIAARLYRSERTVEHHVSAILGKLGVRSRTQAVARLLAASPPTGPKSG